MSFWSASSSSRSKLGQGIQASSDQEPSAAWAATAHQALASTAHGHIDTWVTHGSLGTALSLKKAQMLTGFLKGSTNKRGK